MPVKLARTPEQHATLLATVERFNAACNALAEVAFRERLANKVALQKLVYYEVRERFRLSSQMTIRAIAKVVDVCKRDRSLRPVSRVHGAMAYDEHILTWRGLKTVSLLTLIGRQLNAIDFGVYQAARRRRLRGQANLVHSDGVFYLYATLDLLSRPAADVTDYLGVDLGIVNVAADSDGRTFTGESIERQRRRFAHRRRNLQRKQTRAAKRKLQRIGRMQARFQRDTNHCISKSLVRTAEDTQLGAFVQYKSEEAGRSCGLCGLPANADLSGL